MYQNLLQTGDIFLKRSGKQRKPKIFDSISSGKSQSVNPISKKIDTVWEPCGQVIQNNSYFELCYVLLAASCRTVTEERDCTQSKTMRSPALITTKHHGGNVLLNFTKRISFNKPDDVYLATSASERTHLDWQMMWAFGRRDHEKCQKKSPPSFRGRAVQE